MSDAADRRIAKLETHIKNLERRCENQAYITDLDRARIKELEAKLVQRDVYEAEQRLPPEQAVLIKHLATVERCIEAAEDSGGYEYSNCLVCEGDRHHGHDKDCAWLALQLERKPTETMVAIHAVALQEHERRERQRMPREPARPGATLEQMNNIFREMYGMRVEANPLVPPGTAYLTNLSDFRGIPALRQEPAQLVHGEWPDRPQTDEPVAPPDDEDVP